jgi:putative flippase GtrA
MVMHRIPPSLRRVGKFGFVGATGSCLNFILFWGLTALVGIHYLAASTGAFELSMCSNYLLNNKWTFADRSSGAFSLMGLGRYQIVSLGALLIHLGALRLLIGAFGVNPLAANLVAIGLGAVSNFALSTAWAWRRFVTATERR